MIMRLLRCGRRMSMVTACSGEFVCDGCGWGHDGGELTFGHWLLLLLSYAAQNFSGAMARSAKVTIVEAEEIVPIGSLDPNAIHLPGILYVLPYTPATSVFPNVPYPHRSVNRVVQSTAPKQVEIEVLREEKVDPSAEAPVKDEARIRRERIVKRAAKELKEGVSRCFRFVASMRRE